MNIVQSNTNYSTAPSSSINESEVPLSICDIPSVINRDEVYNQLLSSDSNHQRREVTKVDNTNPTISYPKLLRHRRIAEMPINTNNITSPPLIQAILGLTTITTTIVAPIISALAPNNSIEDLSGSSAVASAYSNTHNDVDDSHLSPVVIYNRWRRLYLVLH